MSLFEYKFPELGEGMHEGEIVKLRIQPGSVVTDEDIIMDVQNDKAVVEVPCPVNGKVVDVKVKDGQICTVGELIATIELEGVGSLANNATDAGAADTGVANAGAVNTGAADVGAANAGTADPEAAPEAAAQTPASPPDGAAVEQNLPPQAGGNPAADAAAVTAHVAVLAPPSVRRLARERGIALAQVRATGKHGHVTRDDVLAHAAGGIAPSAFSAAQPPAQAEADAGAAAPAPLAPAAAAQAASASAAAQANPAAAAVAQDNPATATIAEPSPAPRQDAADIVASAVPAVGTDAGSPKSAPHTGEERIPFKGIRRIIANAMVKSAYTAPHVTLMDEVDVTKLVAFREKSKPLSEKKGIKLTYLPFIVKALVAAVREFPVMNASIDEESNEIVYKHYYHVGIATDTENGLIVPVIRDADRKNIWSIASAISDLAVRGREGKLTGQELKGSTITITNIGSAGGMFFTPIINFPEAAILGTGRITEKPVVKDGQIVIGQVMALSLSFDHRIIDGAAAQRCLNYFKQLLADPELLILEA